MRSVLLATPSRYLSLFIAAIGWYSVVGYNSGSFVFWSQVEGDIAALSLVVGSVVVATTALEWQLVWKRALIAVPGRAMASLGVFRDVFLSIVAWLLLGWLVGIVLAVTTYDLEILGEPNYILLASVLSTVPAFVGVGLLVGELTPRLVGPLLTGLLTYGALGLSMYGSDLAQPFVPQANGVPPFDMRYSTWFSSSQVLWFLSIGALAAIALVVRRTRSRFAVGAIAALVVASSGLSAAIAPVASAVDVSVTCMSGSSGIPELCGPELIESELVAIGRPLARIGEQIGVRVKTALVSTGDNDFNATSGELVINLGSFQADPVLSASQIVMGLSHASVQSCADTLAIQLLAEAVADVASNGTTPISEVGRQVAAGLQRDDEWLPRNLERVQACEVGFDELPGLMR